MHRQQHICVFAELFSLGAVLHCIIPFQSRCSCVRRAALTALLLPTSSAHKTSAHLHERPAQVPGLQDAEDAPTDDGTAGAQYYNSARRSREFNEVATGKPINRQSSLLDLQEHE